MMELIRLTASRQENWHGKDDVPDEEEWHCAGSESEFTACGLAHLGTDREAEYKAGKFRNVTCSHCRRIVEYYKQLR